MVFSTKRKIDINDIEILFEFLENNISNFKYIYKLKGNQNYYHVKNWVENYTKNTELIFVTSFKTSNILLSRDDNEILLFKLKYE